MSKITYRSVDVADIEQVSDLRLKLQCEVHDIKLEDVPAQYARKYAEYFEKAIKSKHYYGAVAEVDGRLVSINGLIVYEKPPSLTESSTLVGYVTNVYTLP